MIWKEIWNHLKNQVHNTALSLKYPIPSIIKCKKARFVNVYGSD